MIAPYGGELKILSVAPDEAVELRHLAETLTSVTLSTRSLCDLELLATGAFSPLDRFMGKRDYDRVLDDMRLSNAALFPIPVTLPVSSTENVTIGSCITLRDQKQNPLAVMQVEEVFEWDRREFAQKVLGTDNTWHPLVIEMAGWGDRFISGPVRVFQLPKYYDFPELRLTPRQVRDRLMQFGSANVIAFQTRNPLHRGHEALLERARQTIDGTLLLHPVVGLTKPGDIDHHSRVRTYNVLAKKYLPIERSVLSLLPLAMRFAGPREALWHAIIRRNYGASHFIVGRDHASPGSDEHGQPFYEPDSARNLLESLSHEIGVEALSFDEFVYLPANGGYVERTKVPSGAGFVSLSGTKVRKDFLDRGEAPPEWLMRPEVAKILCDSSAARFKQGFCVWFTGLSGSGKSTTAEILTAILNGYGRRVTLLDGDVVRTNLSAGLGFDRAGRDANIRRIGFVASEIVRHGGVAVCAAISPYRDARADVRKLVGEGFVEVYVATPLAVCEARDPKGMYAKARAGEITSFTGVHDVYEAPLNAEVTIDASDTPAEENAGAIIDHLVGRRYLTDVG